MARKVLLTWAAASLAILGQGEELAASLAEAEGQLEAVEAGLSGDPTCQVALDSSSLVITNHLVRTSST